MDSAHRGNCGRRDGTARLELHLADDAGRGDASLGRRRPYLRERRNSSRNTSPPLSSYYRGKDYYGCNSPHSLLALHYNKHM